MTSTSASQTADPCVETGTRLCNELEECLLDLIVYRIVDNSAEKVHQRAAHVSSSSGPPLHSSYTRLQKIIEDLYALLHYHVITLTGRAQCLLVEGILYRHLQLVSCRVVTAFLRKARYEQRHALAAQKLAPGEKVDDSSNDNNNSSNKEAVEASGDDANLREALLGGALGLDLGDFGALLAGRGLSDETQSEGTKGAGATGEGPFMPRLLPTPPTAVLSSWLASLLPDTDNQRCYTLDSGNAMVTVVPSQHNSDSGVRPQPSLAHQLRRLLHECVAGNSMPAVAAPSSALSSSFYPHASAAGCNGVTEAARKFALSTLRPMILGQPAQAQQQLQQGATSVRSPTAPLPNTRGAVSTGQGPQPNSVSAVRGRGTTVIGSNGGAVGGSAEQTPHQQAHQMQHQSVAQRLGHSHIPDTTFINIPRMSLPVFHCHMLPVSSGEAKAGLVVSGGGGSVVAPVGMLIPSYYADYKQRIALTGSGTVCPTDTTHSEEGGEDPALRRDQRLQQALFELNEDQRSKRSTLEASSKSHSLGGANVTNTVDVGIRQRHWRSRDPFAVMREAAARYTDAVYAAEEDEENEKEELTETDAGVSITKVDVLGQLTKRLAKKRAREVESTYGLLVARDWLNGTLDEMEKLAMFADGGDFFGDESNANKKGGKQSLSEIVEEFVAQYRATCREKMSQPLNSPLSGLSTVFAQIERNKAVQPLGPCRDPQHVVRFSRALLFTPAVVRAGGAVMQSSSSPVTDASLVSSANNTVGRRMLLSRESADRLWAADSLYFSRREPNEGNVKHQYNPSTASDRNGKGEDLAVEIAPHYPIEPRAVMPVIYRPVGDDDIFSGLRAAEQKKKEEENAAGVGVPVTVVVVRDDAIVSIEDVVDYTIKANANNNTDGDDEGVAALTATDEPVVEGAAEDGEAHFDENVNNDNNEVDEVEDHADDDGYDAANLPLEDNTEDAAHGEDGAEVLESGSVSNNSESEGRDDEDEDEDEVPPPPSAAAARVSTGADSLSYISPQDRLTLVERVALEFAIRKKIAS